MKRRRDMIISQILDICINGANKTQIVYRANLTFKTANIYLDALKKNGLIDVKTEQTAIYKTTSKGLDLLDNFKHIESTPNSENSQKFDYDVALSYASEQRDYVKPLAIKLKNMGIKVFYDEFEEHNLWGKDLPEYLDEIYWKKSKYCVIFISDEYAKKSWTTHEKKSALARALKERAEYILPVRFDDTEIPGIRPTIGYIDARKRSTEELAKIIKWKLLGQEIHIVKNISTYTNHSLSFKIPDGWGVSSEKKINNIQMDGTSINDTQIILSEGPSVIRVDIIEIPQIKWLLNMYDDGPWYVTGVLESLYRNHIIEISIPESLKGGSGIPVNPDGTKDMSFRTSSSGDKTEWIIAWVKPEYADKFIAVHAIFQGDQLMKSLSMSGSRENYYMQKPLYEILTSFATQFGNNRK